MTSIIKSPNDDALCLHAHYEQQSDFVRDISKRPSITPVCSCALMFWLACALAYSRGAVFLQADLEVFSLGALAGVLAMLACAWKWEKRRLVFLVFAALLLGAGLGFGQAYSLLSCAKEVSSLREVEGELELLEDSSAGSFYEQAQALLRLKDGREFVVQARFNRELLDSILLKQGLTSPSTQQTERTRIGGLLYGQSFSIRGDLKDIDHATNEYAWQHSYAAILQVNVCVPTENRGIVEMLVRFRQRALAQLQGEDDSSTLLQAISCGYRRSLKASTFYGPYQSCGLAHLVAVSGAHLVIVTGLFAGFFTFIGLPRKLVVVLLVGIMLSYLVLSGAPISALRAIVMSSVGIIALVGKRRPSSQNALGISVFLLVAMNPASSISLSFALSALSTLGIVLFAPLFMFWIQKTPFGQLKVVAEALSLTCAASLLSQGLACSVFSVLPLASPLANIVVAPLFPLVCSLGLLASFAGALNIPGFQVLMAVAKGSADLLNEVVGLVASIPHSAMPFACGTEAALVVSFLIAAALWITWGHVKKRVLVGALALVLVLAIWNDPSRFDRIVMLDVGQGDAFLLQSKGESLLIDTGNQDTMLMTALAEARIASLDLVALTHPDDDHIGSLDVLNRNVRVDAYIVPKGLMLARDAKSLALHSALRQTSVSTHDLPVGTSFSVGAFTCTVVWPLAYEAGENADSLCLWVDYDGDEDGAADFTALFTGDAEIEQLQEIIDQYRLPSVDIFKVGHHGSKNAFTAEQVHALSPRIALISVGAHNRYGHPADSILEMLEHEGAAILRSDIDGQVEIRLTPHQLVVQ